MEEEMSLGAIDDSSDDWSSDGSYVIHELDDDWILHRVGGSRPESDWTTGKKYVNTLRALHPNDLRYNHDDFEWELQNELATREYRRDMGGDNSYFNKKGDYVKNDFSKLK